MTSAMSGLRTEDAALTASDLLSLLRQMSVIREFEQKTLDLFARAQIPGIAHVSIGQEAVPVGVCAALRPDDYITSTHRGHGHCLAKGADPGRMFAEMFGRATGYCGGKGGSMHIADPCDRQPRRQRHRRWQPRHRDRGGARRQAQRRRPGRGLLLR